MPDDIPELERRLHSANQQVLRAREALAPKHKGGEWEAYWAARHDRLQAERRLAAARGEPYAEATDFPLQWDAAAPMPQLLVNDNRALLAFILSESDAGSNSPPAGAAALAGSPAQPWTQVEESWGLVAFDQCFAAKLGGPNDEVLHGHPLAGKGLEADCAQRVVNSRWLEELERINSVHHSYRPEYWRDRRQFVFWFHDSTFECIAQSYRVETHRLSAKALLALMAERLLD